MGRPAGQPRDSKQLICEQALALFAQKGYAATTMKDIAAASGMRDASLYNHFPGKQALFDAVVARQLDRLSAMLRDRSALVHPDDDAHAYLEATGQSLLAVVLASYEPFFNDGQIERLRQVLEAERHADERIGALYRTIFIERPLEIQRSIFSQLIEAGTFAPCDAELAARQFHGPVYLALAEGTAWPDARAFIARHLASFQDQHRAKEQP